MIRKAPLTSQVTGPRGVQTPTPPSVDSQQLSGHTERFISSCHKTNFSFRGFRACDLFQLVQHLPTFLQSLPAPVKMSANDIFTRTVHLTVPRAPSDKDRVPYVLLGLLNCFFFGLGMIIIGFMENDVVNMMIGVLQLLLPVVGWIWAIVWGVLIIVKTLVPGARTI